MADQTNQTTTDQTTKPAEQEGKWMKRAKTAAKWTGIGLVCAAVGAGGYFAAQAYQNRGQ